MSVTKSVCPVSCSYIENVSETELEAKYYSGIVSFSVEYHHYFVFNEFFVI